MSRIVPRRDARRHPSETYRPHAEAVVRVEMPSDLRVERGCEMVMESAYTDGREWGLAGKKKDPARAGIPAWCVECWCAGYEAGVREVDRHAATKAAV